MTGQDPGSHEWQHSVMPIRAAEPDDLPRLQEIEYAAGEAFRQIGMAEIADDEAFPLDVLDRLFHIEQVSVHSEAAGHGLGRELIEHLAAERHSPALTLTTFADVPWNAPYYARLGFSVLDRPGPGLRSVQRKEAEHGLDRWPRIAMIRALQR